MHSTSFAALFNRRSQNIALSHCHFSRPYCRVQSSALLSTALGSRRRCLSYVVEVEQWRDQVLRLQVGCWHMAKCLRLKVYHIIFRYEN